MASLTVRHKDSFGSATTRLALPALTSKEQALACAKADALLARTVDMRARDGVALASREAFRAAFEEIVAESSRISAPVLCAFAEMADAALRQPLAKWQTALPASVGRSRVVLECSNSVCFRAARVADILKSQLGGDAGDDDGRADALLFDSAISCHSLRAMAPTGSDAEKTCMAIFGERVLLPMAGSVHMDIVAEVARHSALPMLENSSVFLESGLDAASKERQLEAHLKKQEAGMSPTEARMLAHLSAEFATAFNDAHPDHRPDEAGKAAVRAHSVRMIARQAYRATARALVCLESTHFSKAGVEDPMQLPEIYHQSSDAIFHSPLLRGARPVTYLDGSSVVEVFVTLVVKESAASMMQVGESKAFHTVSPFFDAFLEPPRAAADGGAVYRYASQAIATRNAWLPRPFVRREDGSLGGGDIVDAPLFIAEGLPSCPHMDDEEVSEGCGSRTLAAHLSREARVPCDRLLRAASCRATAALAANQLAEISERVLDGAPGPFDKMHMCSKGIDADDPMQIAHSTLHFGADDPLNQNSAIAGPIATLDPRPSVHACRLDPRLRKQGTKGHVLFVDVNSDGSEFVGRGCARDVHWDSFVDKDDGVDLSDIINESDAVKITGGPLRDRGGGLPDIRIRVSVLGMSQTPRAVTENNRLPAYGPLPRPADVQVVSGSGAPGSAAAPTALEDAKGAAQQQTLLVSRVLSDTKNQQPAQGGVLSGEAEFELNMQCVHNGLKATITTKTDPNDKVRVLDVSDSNGVSFSNALEACREGVAFDDVRMSACRFAAEQQAVAVDTLRAVSVGDGAAANVDRQIVEFLDKSRDDGVRNTIQTSPQKLAFASLHKTTQLLARSVPDHLNLAKLASKIPNDEEPTEFAASTQSTMAVLDGSDADKILKFVRQPSENSQEAQMFLEILRHAFLHAGVATDDPTTEHMTASSLEPHKGKDALHARDYAPALPTRVIRLTSHGLSQIDASVAGISTGEVPAKAMLVDTTSAPLPKVSSEKVSFKSSRKQTVTQKTQLVHKKYVAADGLADSEDLAVQFYQENAAHALSVKLGDAQIVLATPKTSSSVDRGRLQRVLGPVVQAYS